MRELLGNAYSFPTIFKSVLSSTCVSLWLLILFFCLLKNVTRPCLTFWHLVRLKVLQVVTVGAHNRYTYIYIFFPGTSKNQNDWRHAWACNDPENKIVLKSSAYMQRKETWQSHRPLYRPQFVFFHRCILKYSVCSLQSPAFKAAPAAPNLLLVAI